MVTTLISLILPPKTLVLFILACGLNSGIDVTVHRGYDWHGASIKNVMNAIDSLARDLPGVPESLKTLPGMKPDADRLFMAGEFCFPHPLRSLAEDS